MSKDFEKLVPELKLAMKHVFRELQSIGLEMKPYYTERSPWEQARIWRSTRTSTEIYHAIDQLRNDDADYLAGIILAVGVQYSPPGVKGHLTNALPGNSWHQWRNAIDCFWVVESRAEWSINKTIPVRNGTLANGYREYARLAQHHGLLSGGLKWGWDWPHVQHPKENSPSDTMSWKVISEQMYKMYGSKEVS